MNEAEFEQLEFQTQHEGTWQTLQAATNQRDLVVKLHGGTLVVLTIALPALNAAKASDDEIGYALLGFVALATALLGAASWAFLTGVQSLRLLQFEMYSACRYSRWVLNGRRTRETYFSDLLERPRMVRLSEQRDPMGLTVANVRHFVLVDAFVAPASAGAAGAMAATGPVLVAASLLSALVGAVLCVSVRHLVDKRIREEEQELSEKVVRRYRALAVPLRD